MSVPITRHPFAFNICTVSCPMMPSPITTNVSPMAGARRLMPCIAMAPTVAVLASSKLTESGIFTTKFLGTVTYSA